MPFRSDSLLKWKQLHTVDFQVDGCRLLVVSRGKMIEKAKLEAGASYPSGSIVECRLDGKDWRVMKVREDKTAPNDSFVFNKTVLNIKEDIQRSEFSV